MIPLVEMCRLSDPTLSSGCIANKHSRPAGGGLHTDVDTDVLAHEKSPTMVTSAGSITHEALNA
jgi:hypothetical protein